jgi:alkylation response protein AidB-like acyl-CoA dehydrogenase
LEFGLNEEQLMLKALVERQLAEHYGPGKRARYRASPLGFAQENWAQLGQLGLLAAPFLPEHGGLAGGIVEIMVLMEALGRWYAVEPVLEQVITPGRLLAHGSAGQSVSAWLARIISAEAHVALAHVEQSAGQDLCSVQTVARAGSIDGEKSFVPGSGGVDAFIVSARDAGSEGARTLRFHVVERGAPGLEIVPFRIADGSVAAALRLRGVRPVETLSADLDSFLRAVDETRIAACAEMLGIMSSLFEATLEHVRTRKQFGVPLGSFQVIQHRLADLYVLLEQSRSQLYRAALRGGQSRPDPVDVAAMKSYISGAAIEMGEQCIHLHGGMGITDELAIGHGHKRLVVLAAMFGDADHELLRYARLVA